MVEDYHSRYWGKCKEAAEARAAADPTLTLVRGRYHCPVWGERAHWWCKRPDGTIVDPTKDQFQGIGIGEYVEIDGKIAAHTANDRGGIEMKAVRTVREMREERYTGSAKPEFKRGDYVRIYSGPREGCEFYVKDIRFNHDLGKFEYLDATLLGGWYVEGSIISGSSRKGRHYDSQGYCDNPGRGY